MAAVTFGRGTTSVKPVVRVRLEHDGYPVFGPGPHELLCKVRDRGSLRRAAQEMNMAYSKAWRLVHDAEQHLGLKILERTTGGVAGGGSVLADDGEELIRRFGALQEDIRDELQRLFVKHFGDTSRADASPPASGPNAGAARSSDRRA